MKIARIVWRDHFTVNGWQDASIASAFKDGALIESVGYVVKENKKIVMIAQSLTEDGFGDITTIIKSCIDFREVVGEVGDAD